MPSSPSSSTHSAKEVAGSAPPSPTTTMTSTQTDIENDTEDDVPTAGNLLDDIFGSSPPQETSGNTNPHLTLNSTTTPTPSTASVEPSDIPSLRRQHVTAGYRDGMFYSKSQHVQRGFDAGFPVGAQYGLRVGTVLGILEGVLKGLDTQSSSGPVKKQAAGTTKVAESADAQETRQERVEKIRQLYQTAVQELGVESVFGGVVAAEEDGEKPEARLAKKADPIVSKWEETAAVPKWEENMESLEEGSGHEHGQNFGEAS